LRRSKTLEKIRNGEVVRICGLGHFIPAFVRMAAENDFDCIWLDLEHRAMDAREIQGLMAFFHLFDIDCVLRPPTLEKSRLYRYLEDGATGLMIPHVSTPEKAESLVQSVKFPPLGDRGADGAGMDVEFSLQDVVSYAEEANRETFLFVQIETIEGLNNVDKIAAVEGIDGIFFGPGDLSLRLSHHDDDSLTIDKARQIVADACRRHGIAWGQPAPSKELLGQLISQGAQLLVHGSEFLGMLQNLTNARETFNDSIKNHFPS